MDEIFSEATLENDLEILRRASNEGRFPRWLLEKVLVRVDGDIERCLADVDEIRYREYRRLADHVRNGDLGPLLTTERLQQPWEPTLDAGTYPAPERKVAYADRSRDNLLALPNLAQLAVLPIRLINVVLNMAWIILRSKIYWSEALSAAQKAVLAAVLRDFADDLERSFSKPRRSREKPPDPALSD